MTWVFLLVVVVGLVVMRARRGQRIEERAGIVAERPQFFVEPPRRSYRNVKGERL